MLWSFGSLVPRAFSLEGLSFYPCLFVSRGGWLLSVSAFVVFSWVNAAVGVAFRILCIPSSSPAGAFLGRLKGNWVNLSRLQDDICQSMLSYVRLGLYGRIFLTGLQPLNPHPRKPQKPLTASTWTIELVLSEVHRPPQKT